MFLLGLIGDREEALDEELVIYASRWKLLLLFLRAASSVVGGVRLLVLGLAGPAIDILWIIVGIALLFRGPGAGYFLFRLLFSRPILAVTEEGIVDNASAAGVGLLRWEEIENVITFEKNKQRFVGIVPKDIEAVVARQDAFTAFLIRYNLREGLAPISIPQMILPMRVDDLAAALRGQYEARANFQNRRA